jgi:hypothetical protein
MIDLLPFWLSLIVLGAWAVALVGMIGVVISGLFASAGLRRPAPPAAPPPAPPDREVANTAASIVREQADRDRAAIAGAGTDVDKLADIGRGQR